MGVIGADTLTIPLAKRGLPNHHRADKSKTE